MGARRNEHIPVLLDEVLENLNLMESGIYIDCTFGRGGHSLEILKRLGEDGRLLAIDRDPEAVEVARKLAVRDKRLLVEWGPFSMLGQLAANHGLAGKVNGILLDLGVSSPQLENGGRGFSFSHDGPLDMRMDPTSGVSAASWLADARERDIAEVLKRYGEERHARRIAAALVRAREEAPIETTGRLAELVAQAHPAWQHDLHPATRSFQAIRIFINRELEQLEGVLPQALELLQASGRLLVISFHSLEDRIVKRFLRRQAKGDEFPPEVPVTAAQMNPKMKLTGKAIRPAVLEIETNPRARSATLRVAEKLE